MLHEREGGPGGQIRQGKSGEPALPRTDAALESTGTEKVLRLVLRSHGGLDGVTSSGSCSFPLQRPDLSGRSP